MLVSGIDATKANAEIVTCHLAYGFGNKAHLTASSASPPIDGAP
ncbi:MAG: hypothetical protein U1F43_26245 [Myxococcota bacterium]